MKILQKICFVLLLMTTFSSVYGGNCFKDYHVDDCLMMMKAEQGDSDAQNSLGLMYDTGQDVLQDYTEAVKWYRKSAEQGFSEAQYNLGIMYSKGLGVLQDYKASIRWFRKSAEQGYASAQYNLGVMYYKGQGVPQDYVMAHMYWHLAAVSGAKDAIKFRSIVEKKMSALQLEESQKLAREWMRKY